MSVFAVVSVSVSRMPIADCRNFAPRSFVGPATIDFMENHRGRVYADLTLLRKKRGLAIPNTSPPCPEAPLTLFELGQVGVES